MTRTVKPIRPIRTCPECGQTFTATHGQMSFCCKAHKSAWHHRQAARGQVLLPFAMVSRLGKSGFTDERRYALAQYNALVDRFNAEDKAKGRRPDLIVSRKNAEAWSAHDLG